MSLRPGRAATLRDLRVQISGLYRVFFPCCRSRSVFFPWVVVILVPCVNARKKLWRSRCCIFRRAYALLVSVCVPCVPYAPLHAGVRGSACRVRFKNAAPPPTRYRNASGGASACRDVIRDVCTCTSSQSVLRFPIVHVDPHAGVSLGGPGRL